MPEPKNLDVFARKERELFTTVGEVMSLWARIEFHLLRIFTLALGIKIETAASLLYPVKTFSLAMDLTNAAVRSRVGNENIRSWTTLVEYIRELSGDRNYMAHTTTLAYMPTADLGEADYAKALCKIGPSITGHLVGQERKNPIDLAEATEIALDIQQAIDLLTAFHDRLGSGDASIENFDEPVVRRRPPRNRRRETTHKGNQPPPQPSPE